MRRFVDLHLIPPLKDSFTIKKMVNTAFDIGLSAVAFTFPMDTPLDEIEKVRFICREVGVDFASRTDLSQPKPSDLIRALRKIRKKFEIVGVCCVSQSVARCAAKDSRVDILNFPVETNFAFDRRSHIAIPMSAALEIDVISLTQFQGVERAKLISKLNYRLEVAQKLHIPIVISSGATNWAAMRGPIDMAALVSLVGLDLRTAIEAVSTMPMAILTRNRMKLNPDFVMPGVRVIRRKIVANSKSKT
jgi:RNase P/RNase MRP subunit p30